MTVQDLTNKGCWVIDRKISIGFILAVFVHVIAMTTWIVRLEGRVNQLEVTDARHETSINDMQRVSMSVESMRTDISWIRQTIGQFHSGGK